MEIRSARSQDVPFLKALWHEVFGDDPRFIDFFFAARFSPERTLTALDRTARVCGACYLLPCTVVTAAGPAPADMLYALAVSKDSQGQGVGTALLEAAKERASRKHASLILSPASESLVSYYSARGFLPFSFLKKHQIPAGPALSSVQMRPCSPAEYMRLRDVRYQEPGTVRWDEEAIAWAQKHYAWDGGQTSLFEVDGIPGAVIWHRKETTLYITEMTFPIHLRSAAARLLMQQTDSSTAVLDDPEASEGQVFGMIWGMQIEKGYFNLSLE